MLQFNFNHFKGFSFNTYNLNIFRIFGYSVISKFHVIEREMFQNKTLLHYNQMQTSEDYFHFSKIEII